MRNGLSKGGRGQVKILGEVIVCRGGWAREYGMCGHLSLKGVIIKARGCEEERRESGDHLSLCQAKWLPPRFMKFTRENFSLREIHKGGSLQCI